MTVSVVAAVGIGPVGIAFGEVWRIIGHRVAPGLISGTQTATDATIIVDLRLPRVLLGAVVGAGLAVVGTAIQALVRNPLADPYIIGVTSGASLGAVTVIVLGLTPFGIYSLSTAAFAGAVLAFVAVYLMARQGGQVSPLRLILAGVAVSALLSAITSYIVIQANDQNTVRSALFWLLGGLSGTRWPELTIPAVVLLCGTVFLILQGRALNAMAVGEETAVTLGIDVNRLRKQLVGLCALITGVLVAVSGSIGFVALMVPHAVRFLVGSDHRRVLPVAALVGAIFLVWVDVAARTVAQPVEVPIGVMTSAIGAPFFLWLLRRQDARSAGRT